MSNEKPNEAAPLDLGNKLAFGLGALLVIAALLMMLLLSRLVWPQFQEAGAWSPPLAALVVFFGVLCVGGVLIGAVILAPAWRTRLETGQNAETAMALREKCLAERQAWLAAREARLEKQEDRLHALLLAALESGAAPGDVPAPEKNAD